METMKLEKNYPEQGNSDPDKQTWYIKIFSSVINRTETTFYILIYSFVHSFIVSLDDISSDFLGQKLWVVQTSLNM